MQTHAAALASHLGRRQGPAAFRKWHIASNDFAFFSVHLAQISN